MKRRAFLLLFFAVLACKLNLPQEKKAEYVVGVYLDSLNYNSKNYKIFEFKHLHPIYSVIDDDPRFQECKSYPLKLDSLKKHFKHQITAWVIYVRYRGKDQFNNFGVHSSQCWLDKDLTKCRAEIPVNKLPSW